MGNKTLAIDLSSDRLLNIAEELIRNHNYLGALKMLKRHADLYGDVDFSFALYIDVYDKTGLNEKFINAWFRLVDVAPDPDWAEVYEELAIGYMNIGNEHFSAYYYNKLLNETDSVDAEEREEILKDFMRDENPLKFSYPPVLADFSEAISEGIAHMKAGEYDLAAQEFDKVVEGNDKYESARNYIAMCNVICDRLDEAEQECINVLKRHPSNVQALTTLAAVKTEAGKTEEALALAKKLLNIKTENPDDIYKIATVCCENKLHEEAFIIFSRIKDELAYDLNVLYFTAIAAFNCGRYDDCFKTFDRLLTFYPDAVTARYYCARAREMVDSGETEELSYFYRLPQEVRETSLKLLAAYMKLPVGSAKKLSSHLDLTGCINWAFDESERGADELRELAAQVAVKAGLDEKVREILLNAFLPDQMKINILTAIAERNRFDCFGVVICNIYKRVTFDGLSLGKTKRKIFITAYAKLVAHFSIIEDDNGKAFVKAAETLYKDMLTDGRLEKPLDSDALTAAVYIKSGVNCDGVNGNVYKFFETTEKKVGKILGEK